jgi:hypothetical protein
MTLGDPLAVAVYKSSSTLPITIQIFPMPNSDMNNHTREIDSTVQEIQHIGHKAVFSPSKGSQIIEHNLAL